MSDKNIILKAENISKQYRLGTVGTGTLSHDLNRWWHAIQGKEDPYLKVGDANDRSSKGTSEYVWALKDINFEVEAGEVLGIIGKNGAGKSTLLKILSKVTTPTSGSIKYKGRIASLLEVGTGFNPELTGRENIYLNGAILGMTKKEITSKLGEIIEFSGCERYIDTPTKRYSSGMTVRLAFAVAAFLEPEILVVDEVLAVGDAEFQKKAIGKMQDISREDGRTVLFVSHNMAAIKSLCTRGIVLENGMVGFAGSIEECVEHYNANKNRSYVIYPNSEKQVYLKSFISYNEKSKSNTLIPNHDAVFELIVYSNQQISNIYVGIGLNDLMSSRLITPYSLHTNKSFELKEGENKIFCYLKPFPLKSGDYEAEVYIGTKGEQLDYYDKGLLISVEENIEIPILNKSQGYFIINQEWRQ